MYNLCFFFLFLRYAVEFYILNLIFVAIDFLALRALSIYRESQRGYCVVWITHERNVAYLEDRDIWRDKRESESNVTRNLRNENLAVC